jgi:hypothetical protein
MLIKANKSVELQNSTEIQNDVMQDLRATVLYNVQPVTNICVFFPYMRQEGRDSSVGIATGYGLDGPGSRFSTPVQIGPWVYPASYTMGTVPFPGVKRPGRGVGHPPTSVAVTVLQHLPERFSIKLKNKFQPSCES